MKRILLIIVAIAAFRAPASASLSLSWNGLRIGMPANSARELLIRSGYTLKVSSIPCVADRIAASKGAKLVSRCINGIVANRGDINVVLGLFEDYPKRPGTMEVLNIGVNLFNATSSEVSSFTAEVLNRYGKPTVTDGKLPWQLAMWCFERCQSIANEARSGDAPPYIFYHRGSGLLIIDKRSAHRRVSAIMEDLKRHGVRVDPFAL